MEDSHEVPPTSHPTHPPGEILSVGETLAGYQVLGPLIDERAVLPRCFVRDGWIIQRATSELTVEHNLMRENLVVLLRDHVVRVFGELDNQESRVQEELRLNTDQTGTTYREIIPDIAVYPEPILGDPGSAPLGNIPVLVVEILSKSTTIEDLGEKKRKYKMLGVGWYWALRKGNDPNFGLERSFFFKLAGNRYRDISDEFRDNYRLSCPELKLELAPEHVWLADRLDLASLRLVREEKQKVEEERRRADEERRRADEEKRKREKLEALLKKRN